VLADEPSLVPRALNFASLVVVKRAHSSVGASISLVLCLNQRSPLSGGDLKLIFGRLPVVRFLVILTVLALVHNPSVIFRWARAQHVRRIGIPLAPSVAAGL
jgi:hypothetical protein